MANLVTVTESLPVITGGTEYGAKNNTDSFFKDLVNGGGMAFCPGNVNTTKGGVNFRPVKRRIDTVTALKWRFLRWVDTDNEKNIFTYNYIREAYRASYYNRATKSYQHPWDRSWGNDSNGATIRSGHIITDTDANHQVEFDLTNAFSGVTLKDFVKLPRFDLAFYHYSAKNNTVYLSQMYLDVTYTYDPDFPYFKSVNINPGKTTVGQQVLVSVGFGKNSDL